MTIIQRLKLDVVEDPSVLLRIVCVCHQRGCRIASLQYDRTADAGLVILGVDGDSQHAERLGLWLSNVVHVLAVSSSADADKPSYLAVERQRAADSGK